MLPDTCSRPKNVGEVAYQEEVVSTLTKALETANVSPYVSFRTMRSLTLLLLVTAPPPPFLWPAR